MGAACAWVRAARTFGASLPKRTTSRTMRRKAGRSRLLRCANTVSRSPTEALRAHARIEGGRRGPASGRMRWLHALAACAAACAAAALLHAALRWRLRALLHALAMQSGAPRTTRACRRRSTAQRTCQTARCRRRARPGSRPGAGTSSGCRPGCDGGGARWGHYARGCVPLQLLRAERCAPSAARLSPRSHWWPRNTHGPVR